MTEKQKEIIKTKVDEIFEDATRKVTEDRRNKAQNVKAQNWKEILQSSRTDAAAKGATQSTVRFSDSSGRKNSLVTAIEQDSFATMSRPIDPCIENPDLCDPGNIPPHVSITASPTSGNAPLAVNFTANASDPDGYITSYSWNFGDGQTASSASVSHTYQTAGNFTASVIVTDDFGNSAGASVVITTNGTSGQGTDADNDGLPETFENAVADAFTPVYYVSASEPDQFSTFVPNTITQIVQTNYGQSPVSHFRVQPVGFAYNYYNQLVSVIRIDYLTLWNNDSGLVTGGACNGVPGAGTLLAGLTGHSLDNERSVVLLAAPVSSYNFNLNPNA